MYTGYEYFLSLRGYLLVLVRSLGYIGRAGLNQCIGRNDRDFTPRNRNSRQRVVKTDKVLCLFLSPTGDEYCLVMRKNRLQKNVAVDSFDTA